MAEFSPRNAAIAELSPGALLLPPLAATALLWFTSPNSVEPTATVYGSGLLLMSWGSLLCWRQGSREGLPVFAVEYCRDG